MRDITAGRFAINNQAEESPKLSAQHFFPRHHPFVFFYHAVHEHLRILSFRRIASFPLIVPLSQVVPQQQPLIRRIFGRQY